jgi:chemotaxis signal transduction protein
MFHGAPIVVADMPRVLDTGSLDTPRIVVVIKTPNRRDPFGVLVESLGDISEVSQARLLPIADSPNEHNQLVEHAIQPLDPKDVLMLTLNIDRLSALVGGAVSNLVANSEPAARNVA